MSFWACAQLETNRTRLAVHCLDKVAGYEIYNPVIREPRRRGRGRKVMGVSQLFPAYVFVLIVSGWWNARWSPGVIRLVMDGERPAVVPDAVISEIRGRERNGFVVLPKLSTGLKKGQSVKILRGAFEGRLALYDGMAAHERECVLLDLLGRYARLELPSRDIIAATVE